MIIANVEENFAENCSRKRTIDNEFAKTKTIDFCKHVLGLNLLTIANSRHASWGWEQISHIFYCLVFVNFLPNKFGGFSVHGPVGTYCPSFKRVYCIIFANFDENFAENCSRKRTVDNEFKGIDQWEKRWLNLLLFDWSRYKLFTLKFSKESACAGPILEIPKTAQRTFLLLLKSTFVSQ